MSIRHPMTQDGMYGYNCPHFSMIVRITSTIYAQATDDVANIIGCPALLHDAVIHADRHNYVTGGVRCEILQQRAVSYLTAMNVTSTAR